MAGRSSVVDDFTRAQLIGRINANTGRYSEDDSGKEPANDPRRNQDKPVARTDMPQS